MDQKTREYFERRAQQESLKANNAPERHAARVHRELEKLYRTKLAEGSNQLDIVAEG